VTAKTGTRVAYIEFADPKKGISKAEYESLCVLLGTVPTYLDPANAPADSTEAERELTEG
jgi:hypothetical protein